MKNLLVSCLAMILVLNLVSAQTYYVRTDGDNRNDGLKNKASSAWKTIDFALTKLKPGDELLVSNGVYVSQGIFVEDLHGTQEQPIRIAAQNVWGAKITRDEKALKGKSVFVVSKSSYLEIDGFEVYDNQTALESGIDVRNHSHHIEITNCYVHDCGCGGISSRKSDYLVFDHNVVRGNAKRNEWNCSGISIWHPIEHDQKPGFHIVIKNNVAFENECDLPFRPLGHDNPTDGNGIIVDDFHATQNIPGALGQKGGFKASVLIENNLCFNNGGRGINVYKSDNVFIRNNTCYHNLRIISKYMDFPGEITLSNSNGSQVYNNIIVKNPSYPTKSLRCYKNDSLNTKIYNNVIIGPKDFCGQSLFEKSNQYKNQEEQTFVRFRNPKFDIEFDSIKDFRKYFGLKKKSPAIDAASNVDAPSTDRDGKTRPKGKGGDIGCFESR